MVAYSCQRRFVPDIRAYRKTHTLRGLRTGKSRHARVGERVQLYCGMRTRHCFRIIPDQTCDRIGSVRIIFNRGTVFAVRVCQAVEQPDGSLSEFGMPTEFDGPAALDRFAVSDGFTDADDMSRFWRDVNRVGPNDIWHGALIGWVRPVASPGARIDPVNRSEGRTPEAEADGRPCAEAA